MLLKSQSIRIILLSILSLLLTQNIAAQYVKGKILDHSSKNIIPDVIVMLLDKDDRVIGFSSTDSDGVFLFKNVSQEEFRLKIQRMDYLDKVITMKNGNEDNEDILIELIPASLQMKEIEVTDKKIQAFLREFGFYDRMEHYSGTFITPVEIKKMNQVGEIRGFITKLPGITYDEYDKKVFLARNETLGIPANVYIDGVLVQQGGGKGIFNDGKAKLSKRSGIGVDSESNPFEFLNPLDISAIEIYKSSAEAPSKYSSRSGGVILIWTGRIDR